MVVLLSESGNLAVTYLGTDPISHIASAPEMRELDYDSMDAEHKRLLKVIRDANTSSLAEPTDKLRIETAPRRYVG